MKEAKGTVLLSFDVEEFDMPLEYGQQVSMEQQMRTGMEGFEVVMDIIDKAAVPATLFTTANFAAEHAGYMKQLHPRHEIASHTYYHSDFKVEDLLLSKQKLEEITGRKVSGLRMPRMRPVDMADVKQAGYQYDSSINPTWVPGRYNNRHLPRTIYNEEGMTRLPASVTPVLRIPLFWLSFKNFPLSLFISWVKQTLKKDGYVCLYFHPWEFVDLSDYKIPGYTKRHAGKPLQERLKKLIQELQGHNFSTIDEYLKRSDSRAIHQ
ncbi:polysaccharide deacetylase family protein [Aridibaculum aurantiacum]|uniref:polysaccharide deacetylase family protein n=1 Tax=Aridibaculum aurantiacum TaxID=2810307 RepID=UPI001A965269|nr:polysaccharide deacetylase family protein [Aridibaculum aurantiacum]